MVKLACILFFGLSLITAGLSAQQNFFNVPSFEITAKKKLFVQEQLNINQIIQSNLTLDYGLGKNFQVGLNVVGINLFDTKTKFSLNDSSTKDIFEPLFLANAQKTIEVNRYLNVSVGVNQGINLDVATDKIKYAQFDFVLAGSKFWNNRVVAVIGGYYGNQDYFEKSASFGVMVGADVDLYRNKLHFVGDWISGATPASVAVLGFSYFVSPTVPISFGWQIPNVSQNACAFVLEITWNPSLLVTKQEQ